MGDPIFRWRFSGSILDLDNFHLLLNFRFMEKRAKRKINMKKSLTIGIAGCLLFSSFHFYPDKDHTHSQPYQYMYFGNSGGIIANSSTSGPLYISS